MFLLVGVGFWGVAGVLVTRLVWCGVWLLIITRHVEWSRFVHGVRVVVGGRVCLFLLLYE